MLQRVHKESAMSNMFNKILTSCSLALGLMLGGANPAHAILMNMYDDGPGYNQYEPLDPIEPPTWEPPVVEPPSTQPPVTPPPTTPTPPISTPPTTTPPSNNNNVTPGYKVQGDPANCGSAQPTIYSTVACPGTTPDANQITVGNFPDNPGYTKCIKIDNNSNKNYFIPLRTYREWIAFYNAATSSGSQLGMTVRDCTPSLVNGTCGSANGTPASSIPLTNLCSTGSATTFTNTANGWNWTCSGENGGTNASCSATVQCPTGQNWNGTMCLATSCTNNAPPVVSEFSFGLYTFNDDTNCGYYLSGDQPGASSLRAFWNRRLCAPGETPSLGDWCLVSRRVQDARSNGCGGSQCYYCSVRVRSSGCSGGGGGDRDPCSMGICMQEY
jgi:hypothetical protein